MPETTQEPKHIDDWLDEVEPTTGRDNPGEVYARWWLEYARHKATKQMLYSQIMENFRLFCTFEGKRWRVTGASRMGDIWLAENHKRESGYDKRVEVTKCSGWSNNPGEHQPPSDELEMLRSLVKLPDQETEATDSPWWVIIKPRGMIHSASDISSRLTGPFFSRQDAQDHVNARKHAFNDKTEIWCLSGYWSRKFKLMYRDMHSSTSPLLPLQKRLAKWARKVFPHSTQESRLEHLRRELKELEATPTNGEEMADVALILLHMAEEAGVDLGLEMRKKLEINEWRNWGAPDAKGVSHHVKD